MCRVWPDMVARSPFGKSQEEVVVTMEDPAP
jgi:hypothetical protein